MDFENINMNGFIYCYEKLCSIYKLNNNFNINYNYERNPLGNIYVEDLLPDSGLKFLLILESPHTDEINHKPKIPLAGNSGQTVYKALKKNAPRPMGLYVSNNINNCKYGILNVCNLPMQQTEQPKDNEEKNYTTYNDDLEIILKSMINSKTLNYTDENKIKLTNIIYDHFSFRLNIILNKYPDATIVICGKFADKFFNLYKINNPQLQNAFIELPHPSKYDWSLVNKYSKNLNKIKK